MRHFASKSAVAIGRSHSRKRRLMVNHPPLPFDGVMRSLSSWKVNRYTGAVWNDDSDETNPTYQVIVGLEVHAQLKIPTKLFSRATVVPDGLAAFPVNSAIHPFDLAVPGKLPILSRDAVQKAVIAAAALHCEIPVVSRFERKHYTYADLPASYQITQQRWPLAVNGYLECDAAAHIVNKKERRKLFQNKSSLVRCRIERIQLEQDTGKTTTTTIQNNNHDDKGTSSTTTLSRVDFNRAGTALIEIVFCPDLRSSEDTRAVVHYLRQLLQYTAVCSGKMQEGHLRVDCNINLESCRDGTRSPRVEVKNLNSIRHVQDAITYEAKRQAAVFGLTNKRPTEETRTWNVTKRQTELIRVKDGAVDYRFLPEPDLPPLVLDERVLDGETLQEFIATRLPELPADAVERLKQSYNLSEEQARVIAGDPPAIRVLDEAVAVENASPDIVAKLLCNELFALVKDHADDEQDSSVEHSTVSGKQLGELAAMVSEERISSTMAKNLLNLLYTSDQGRNPRDLAADRGFELITDAQTLRELCRDIIAAHPEEISVYRRGGKFVTKMKKLFTGKAMAATKGNAHPERLQETVAEVLEEMTSIDEK